MAKTFDYSPDSGMWYETTDHPDGGIIIQGKQNVTPVLDHVQRKRNDGRTDKGIKRDLWHYATIPAAVWLKMKEEAGINIFDKNQDKEMLRYINRNLPHLKNTYLKHE